MANPNIPSDIEALREPFLAEEPPQEVINNIQRLVVLSGVTDPEEIKRNVKEGLETARKTRSSINRVFEDID